jgi:WD40 repeat protein
VRDRSGNLLHAWQGHQHGTHCAPLADGQRILSGSWDMTVKLWTPGSSPGLPHRSGFPRLALLRVGDLVVAASTDGRLHAFDAAGGIVATAQVSPLVLRLYAHRDARSVWVSEQDGRRLWVWTPALGELRGPVQLATEADAGSESFAHLACDRLLMASGWSRRLHWFDAQGGSVGPPGSKTMRASHVAAAPGGQVAVTVDGSGAIGLLDGAGTWLWEGFEPEAREEAATAFATCLQLSDDGRLLLIGRDDGSVSLWDLGARRRIGHWRDHRQRVRALAIDAAGRRFSSCCSVGHLIVREIGREVPLLEWHSTGETFESVAFAGPDAIVTGGWRRSGRLRWWWWDPKVLRQKVEAMPVMPLGPEQARLLTETLARR